MIVTRLIITDGRRKFFDESLASWDVHIPAVDHTIVVDDSASDMYAGYVQNKLPDAYHLTHHTKQGLAQAIRTAWAHIPPDTDYVIHLEDDVVFLHDVDLDDWVAPLTTNPTVQQVVLRRGPNNGDEHHYGGTLQNWAANGITLTHHAGYITQRHLFCLQPNMYRRALTDYGWPEHGGEREFTDELLAWDPKFCFAHLGDLETPPVYDHVGFARRSNGWTL